MTIPLTGTGGLATRLGYFAGGLNEANTFRGATLDSRVANIVAQFPTAERSVLDGFYASRDSFRGNPTGWLGVLQKLAQNTLIQMAYDDATISPQDLPTALALLVKQMKTAAQSFNKPTVTVTVTPAGGNVGSGVCVASLLDGVDGLQSDYVIAETITATVTKDGYAGGGGTVNKETWSVVGLPRTASDLDYNWPLGSGASKTYSTVDGGAAGGLVTDPDFESWGGVGNNTPTSWTLGTGAVAGTTVLRGSTPYTGGYNLRIAGDGASATALYQQLNLAAVAPQTVYAVCGWAKQAGGPAAGTLQFRLTDNTGTTVKDANSVNNAVTASIAAMTTGYAPVTGFFRTPAVLPSVLRFEVGLSAPLTNGDFCDVDRVQIVPATQFYPGGPYVAFFSGATAFARNDTISIVTTNSLGTASFVRALDRLFGLRGLGVKLPSSGTPTLSDALIL